MFKIVAAFSLIMWTSDSRTPVTVAEGIVSEKACNEAAEKFTKLTMGYVKSICVPTLIKVIQE